MSRELLAMALDALDDPSTFRKTFNARAALRAALAAPEPEPVAWYYVEDPWGANEWHFMTDSPESQECDPRDWTPLYATMSNDIKPAACGWSQDGDSYSDTWATSCGHYFRLDDGTPTDNKMAFCCYCGKSLVSYPFVEDEDE